MARKKRARRNPETKWNTDLLDSQLMMLAQGGDVPSMFELQRRMNTEVPGSHLYRKNPRAVEVWYHEGEGLRRHKKAFETPEAARRWWSEAAWQDVRVLETKINGQRALFSHLLSVQPVQHNPRGQRDMTMLIGEDGAEWAQYDQERRGIYHRNADRRGRMNPRPSRQYSVEAVMGEDGAEWAQWAQDREGIMRRNPRHQGKLHSYGSGPRGGYLPQERAALPSQAFLKPMQRSWPVADQAHARIALQYMVAGRGRPSEYPTLIKRLASLWPVVPQNEAIWRFYSQNRKGIAAKSGKEVPTLAQLKRVRSNPAAATTALVVSQLLPVVLPIIKKAVAGQWDRLLALPRKKRAQSLEKIVKTALWTQPPLRFAWKRLLPSGVKAQILMRAAVAMETGTVQDVAAQIGNATAAAVEAKVAEKAGGK